MKKLFERVLMAGFAGLCAVLLPPQDAYGIEFVVAFTVNDTSDAVDINPGDGHCNSDANPWHFDDVCTLRAAIQETNALAGANVINLPPGTYTLSIAGTVENAGATGDLDIRDDLTIQSTGSSAASTTVVDGGGIDRVFHISGSAAPSGSVDVHLNNFTVRNGSITTSDPANTDKDGAGILAMNTVLHLSGMTITENHNTIGGGGGLNISSSTSVEIQHSTFSNNSAAANSGGGISSDSPLDISYSTISGNSARTAGGIDANGKTFLTNTTISGNSASQSTGGVYLYHETTTPLDRPLLRGVTIVDNSSPDNGTAGGINLGHLTEVILLNSIIANNGNKNCGFNDPTARFTAGGYNLSSDDTCHLTETGDVENTDPKLGPLANNGGRTKTHLPLKDSPVIDAGLPANLIPPGMETDQRGIHRPQGKRVDIGAVEVEEECSFFVIPAKNGKTTAFCL